MRNIPSVTVAISAYNEQKNILKFLRSVLKQKEEGFILEKILVITDGCVDKTVELVKSLNSKKIELRVYPQRAGKSTRLNEIYASLTSDVLVQSDADVIYNHRFVVRDLISPIIHNKNVGMSGGHPTPIPGKTFTEKAVNYTFNAYDKFRSKVRGGNNVFSADGRLLAFRKNLVKKIKVPETMIANDAYTYYYCLTLGFEYRFAPTALVSFRSPKTIKDQIKQNTRFLAAPIRMSKYFSSDMVKKETDIPKLLFFQTVLLEFIKHPFACSYIFLINRYCQLQAKLKEDKLTAKWQMAFSTKNFE